jgi:hypothetical protein
MAVKVITYSLDYGASIMGSDFSLRHSVSSETYSASYSIGVLVLLLGVKRSKREAIDFYLVEACRSYTLA